MGNRSGTKEKERMGRKLMKGGGVEDRMANLSNYCAKELLSTKGTLRACSCFEADKATLERAQFLTLRSLTDTARMWSTKLESET